MTGDGRQAKRTRETELASLAIRRMLSERLSTLATTEVATRILDEAVRRAAMSLVPVDGGELTKFAHGPLREITERTLGEDSAEALVSDLVPLLRAMCAPISNPDESQIRMTVRPEVLLGTVRPARAIVVTPVAPVSTEAIRFSQDERAHSSIPVTFSEYPNQQEIHSSAEFEKLPRRRTSVLLASRSVTRESEMVAALDGAASVTRVEDVFDLVDHASSDPEGSVFVILDGTNSTVRPMTLAAATTELPQGTIVVLWGAQDRDSEGLDLAPESDAWTKLPDSTSTGELVRYLRTAMSNDS